MREAGLPKSLSYAASYCVPGALGQGLRTPAFGTTKPGVPLMRSQMLPSLNGRTIGRLSLGSTLVLCLVAGPAAARDLAEIKAQGTLRVIGVAPLPTDEFLSSLPKSDRPGFDHEIL